MLIKKMTKEYRPCVGMMILNEQNKILVGKRLDHPSGHWQMPQSFRSSQLYTLNNFFNS